MEVSGMIHGDAQITSEADTGYLDSCTIRNYFTIRNMALRNLAAKKEIYFLGENGDGKTLILQAILLALKGAFITGESEKKLTGAVLDLLAQNPSLKLSLKDNRGRRYDGDQSASLSSVFAYGVHRGRGSSRQKEAYGFLTLFGADQFLEDPVEWLKYLQAKENAGEPVIAEATAKEMLRALLDRSIDFDVSPDRVVFSEHGSKLSLDQLSEGYRVVMTWVFDLVSRLAKLQPEAKSTREYQGIVLVDEIELHLHPKWEERLVRRLREWFPRIQFIFTTHSPITVLGASDDAVFYKVYKTVEGETRISEPYDNKDLSHLMANGIATSPLFDLESARSMAFKADSQELETRESYLHHRIYRQVSKKLAGLRAAGELYIAPETIDEIIAGALEELE